MQCLNQILLVDDHPLIADSVSQMLTRHGHDVACADSVTAMNNYLQVSKPTLIILDLDLGDGDGVRNIHRLCKTDQRSVLVFSGTRDKLEVLCARLDGASGFVQKGDRTDELLLAINRILEGGQYWPTWVEEFEHASKTLQETPRHERDVLLCLNRGYSTEEISSSLNISSRSVQNRLTSIFSAFQVKNRNSLRALFRGKT